jgi:hypothetical protein
MTVGEFAELLDRDRQSKFIHEYNMRGQQREGQAVFNAASVVFGNPVGRLADSLVDCFHNDELVPAFLDALAEELTRP